MFRQIEKKQPGPRSINDPLPMSPVARAFRSFSRPQEKSSGFQLTSSNGLWLWALGQAAKSCGRPSGGRWAPTASRRPRGNLSYCPQHSENSAYCRLLQGGRSCPFADCFHIRAEYQGNKAKIEFSGNVLLGDLHSKTALRLVREWIDLHDSELRRDWELARDGRPLEKVAPLE